MREQFPDVWKQTSRDSAAAFLKDPKAFASLDFMGAAQAVVRNEARTIGSQFGLTGEILEKFADEQTHANATPERLHSMIAAYAEGTSDELSALQDLAEPKHVARSLMIAAPQPRDLKSAFIHAFAARRGYEEEMLRLKAIEEPHLVELFSKAFGKDSVRIFHDFVWQRPNDKADSLFKNYAVFDKLTKEERAEFARAWDESAKMRSKLQDSHVLDHKELDRVVQLADFARRRQELPRLPTVEEMTQKLRKEALANIKRNFEYQAQSLTETLGRVESGKEVEEQWNQLQMTARAAARYKGHETFRQALDSYRHLLASPDIIGLSFPDPTSYKDVVQYSRVHEGMFNDTVRKWKEFLTELNGKDPHSDSNSMVRDPRIRMIKAIQEESDRIEWNVRDLVNLTNQAMEKEIKQIWDSEKTRVHGPLLARKQKVLEGRKARIEPDMKALKQIFLEEAEKTELDLSNLKEKQGSLKKKFEEAEEALRLALGQKEAVGKKPLFFGQEAWEKRSEEAKRLVDKMENESGKLKRDLASFESAVHKKTEIAQQAKDWARTVYSRDV